MITDTCMRAVAEQLVSTYLEPYWRTLWTLVEASEEVRRTIPPFLLRPERVIIYLGRHHWAVEYVGNLSGPLGEPQPFKVELLDYTWSQNLIEDLVQLQYDGTSGWSLPLSGTVECAFLPSNDALQRLLAAGWNPAAPSSFLAMNVAGVVVMQGDGVRVRNSFFYGVDSESPSGVQVRYVRWLDVFPAKMTDVADGADYEPTFWTEPTAIASQDAVYAFPLPVGYQYEKEDRLNRFIELFLRPESAETEITRFLADPENQFILKIAFAAVTVRSERECLWADSHRVPIRPDFFIETGGGFWDILEFKLPVLSGEPVVGSENRARFSAEISAYIAQTRVYAEYFSDPRNREFVVKQHGIRVHDPRRLVVAGRRSDFNKAEWKDIQADLAGRVVLRTYDDIVDVVMAALQA
jgi:hypothetical protein